MTTPAADEPGLARDATASRWSRRVMSARPVAWVLQRSKPGVHVLVSASVVIGMAAVVRSAWVSDDAFIALRAVENFVTGHGLLSNPPERVQAFTSPLWALCMALPRALTGEVYFTVIAVSLGLTLATLLLVAQGARDRPVAAALGVLWLVSSRALVDFSTSGLENALAHLLLVAFCLHALRPLEERRPLLVAGLGAAIVLTRLDLAPLVAPACLGLLLEGNRRTALRALALASLPVLAWLGFSLLYYGAPLPNTAYAKLAAGVPRALLWAQGLAYLTDSLSRDVLLPITIAAALALGWRAGGRMHRLLVLGVTAHIAYVVSVGGDFMSGRFLTAPYVVSVMVLVTAVFRRARGATLLGSGALLAAVVLTGPYKALNPPVEPCRVPDHGVTDERSCYADFTGLARNLHKGENWIYQTHNYSKEGRAWRERGERVVVGPLVGLAGVAAGPSVHIIDEAALTDPLLARLPYDYEPTRHWRIGHFYRRVPPGYLETVRDGVNRIEDPCLAKYYAAVREVTRGPLLSGSRLRRIWALNTGRYDRYLEGRCD